MRVCMFMKKKHDNYTGCLLIYAAAVREREREIRNDSTRNPFCFLEDHILSYGVSISVGGQSGDPYQPERNNLT